MACAAGGAQNHKPSVCCHSSQNQHEKQACPDTSRLDVGLQQQWYHAANAHLGNIDIKPYSRHIVWWICDQCPDGHLHRWKASVNDRTRGTGCPQCCSRKVCKHNSLATKAPQIAAQWDFEANDGTPDSVVAQRHQHVGWLCDVCGHKWSARPSDRVRGQTGCPKCARAQIKTKHRTLALPSARVSNNLFCPKGAGHGNSNKKEKYPTFAESQDPQARACLAEWDHEKNALQGKFPSNTTLPSSKPIFWLCTKCPAGQKHSWSAKPHNRTSRHQTGCPFCAGQAACRCNSLQTLYPDIAAEWDYAKNASQPSNYTAGSTYLAWWISPQRGSWQQSIDARTSMVKQKAARLKHIHQQQKSASQL